MVASFTPYTLMSTHSRTIAMAMAICTGVVISTPNRPPMYPAIKKATPVNPLMNPKAPEYRVNHPRLR